MSPTSTAPVISYGTSRISAARTIGFVRGLDATFAAPADNGVSWPQSIGPESVGTRQGWTARLDYGMRNAGWAENAQWLLQPPESLTVNTSRPVGAHCRISHTLSERPPFSGGARAAVHPGALVPIGKTPLVFAAASPSARSRP